MASLHRLFWQQGEIEAEDCFEPLVAEGIVERQEDKLRSLIDIACLPSASGPCFLMSSIPRRSPGEFVYLGDDTGLLLDEMGGRVRGGRLLDMCCGGGGLGLGLGEDFAGVDGVDLNPTAVALARSNALLNRRSPARYRYRQGDLWQGLEGTFDWIIGNPPALPLVSRGTMFAYGGAASTELTRRLLEGLPSHLAEGGQALLLTFSPGNRLWEESCSLLPPALSLHYRVRARFRLGHPEIPVLDHVYVEVRRDGHGTRQYSGPGWVDRLRQWSPPWAHAEEVIPRLP